MRLSLSWLRSYVRLPEDAATVARLLTEHSFETAVVPATPRAAFSRIVVGAVEAVERHPDASRLSLVTVRMGQRASRQLVCGASNVRVGQRVAVALPGAQILDEHGELVVLRAAVIRGVRSPGMICSERELGLGKEHAGILELPADINVGERLDALFPSDDLLDADVLPNRTGDCLSHLGVARELGALLQRPVTWPSFALPPQRGTPPFKVRVSNTALCPFYLASVVEGIDRAAAMPGWMQLRLRAIGVQPQNLVVDVTNYVLWEAGQPTHAFDRRAVGRLLGAREARQGETLRTLDGIERGVPKGALVITGEDRPIGLAGILGGEDSSVRVDTAAVVIESAVFDRSTIRHTAQAANARTEAADRFARGRTPAHAEAGLARVLELLREIGGGRETARVRVGARPQVRRPVRWNPANVNETLGTKVPGTRQKRILEALGGTVKGRGAALTVIPPLFRNDLAIEQDVADEIGRLVGFSAVPAVIPRAPLQPAALPDQAVMIRAIQDVLRSAGWTETLSYSFSAEEETRALGLEQVEHHTVVNPLNRDQVRLRLSLLPNLLHQASTAVKRASELRMFEIGRVYLPGSAARRGKTANAWEECEPLRASGLLVRRGTPTETRQQEAFYEVKGVIEHLLQTLRVADVSFEAGNQPAKGFLSALWEHGQAAKVKLGEREDSGVVGVVSAKLLEQLRIRAQVIIFELDVSALLAAEKAARVYEPPLPFPTIARDLSLLVPLEVLVDRLARFIDERGGPLVQEVRFLDLYEGADLPANRRSVTLRVTYGSRERTLRDAEVNALHEQIIAVLEEQMGVSVRA